MEKRMDTLEHNVKEILEKLEILDKRESRRGKILDKLVDDEVQRQELYRQVKRHVYGTGIVAILTMLCAMLWFGIKEWIKNPAP